MTSFQNEFKWAPLLDLWRWGQTSWPGKALKWASLPTLLIASMFSRFASSYELTVDVLFCLGCVLLVQRAVRMKEYYWASGFAATAVVFSPLGLAIKIFLLMGLACATSLVTLLVAFRTQPQPAECTEIL